MGSDYSSEYEEKEVSEWVTTDAVESDVAPTIAVQLDSERRQDTVLQGTVNDPAGAPI